MRYRPVPKKLLEKTGRMIDVLILINNINKNKSGENYAGTSRRLLLGSEVSGIISL